MKLRNFTIVLAILISCKAYSQSAVGTWHFFGPTDMAFKTLPYIGNGIGRVSAIKFHPTDSQTMYTVGCHGGIFKSINRGQTWSVMPGTDQMPDTKTASVCIDFTDDNILYLGTGDPNSFANGMGVWKSTDGGSSFTQSSTGMGNITVTDIIMSPLDHNTLLASTQAGLYKSSDAGATWSQTQPTPKRVDDIKMKPGSTNTVYAATGTTFYISHDFGSTWISSALPTFPSNNLSARIAVSPADTNRIYLGAAKDNGYILKSTDGGASFSTVFTSSSTCIICYAATPGSGTQGDYDFAMCANPLNANELLLCAETIWRSLDGGSTWTPIEDPYQSSNLMADFHTIVFDPYYPNEVFLSCDGGIWSSIDTLRTIWRARNAGLGTWQIYHSGQHPLFRDVYAIGTQDGGLYIYHNNRWTYLDGGDELSLEYFSYLPGYDLWRPWDSYRAAISDTAAIHDVSFNDPIGQTNSPMAFWPNLKTLAVYGKDTVYRSTNIDATKPNWTSILNSSYGIQDIKFCAADSNVLYVLTNKDTIYRSDNAQAASPTFIKLRAPDATAYQAFLATSKSNPDIVYMTSQWKIYMSKDKGATWQNISSNLPSGSGYIQTVVHDDYSANERLFVMLNSSVYYKDSTTTTWSITTGLESVATARDLSIYNDGTSGGVLRVSTFGRGVWECPIYTNLTPIITGLTADQRYICPGDTVHFSANYYGQPNFIQWSFPGGTPSSSTSPDPVVVYSAAGTYDVQLIIGNSSGSDTITRSSYISANSSGATVLSEKFEEGFFPPVNWLLSSTNSTWSCHATDSAGGYSASRHSAMFDNYDYDAAGKHDKLITAPMNLSGKADASVTFDISYQYTVGYHDSLLIQASTDCGDTWTPLYVKDASQLATAYAYPTLTTGVPFFIPNASNWRTDTVSLKAYVGKTVLLSFENIGHGGSSLYLDNINLTAKGVDVTAVNNNSPEIALYPNPTTGIVYINAEDIAGSQVTINFYNMLGELVSHQIIPVINGSLHSTLSLASLQAGVYQVRIQGDNGFTYNNKIVLQ
jgi:PKD repeat protein